LSLAPGPSGKQNGRMPRYFTPVEDAILATLPPAEVQRLTGRTMPSIIARRVKLKRKGELIADWRTSAERVKVGRSVWTPVADELVRRLRPIEVARLVGTTSASVQRRRTALGLPPIGKLRKPPRTTPKRDVRKWTQAELQIALKLPPKEAVMQLPGRTESAIDAVRFQRKRRGVKFPA
jgi:hypothetical protein